MKRFGGKMHRTFNVPLHGELQIRKSIFLRKMKKTSNALDLRENRDKCVKIMIRNCVCEALRSRSFQTDADLFVMRLSLHIMWTTSERVRLHSLQQYSQSNLLHRNRKIRISSNLNGFHMGTVYGWNKGRRSSFKIWANHTFQHFEWSMAEQTCSTDMPFQF